VNARPRRLICLLTVLVALAGGCTSTDEPIADGSRAVPPSGTAQPLAPTATEAADEDGEDIVDLEAGGRGSEAYPDRDELAGMSLEEACEFAGDEAGWCVDSNGNGWPDLVEQQIGRDPAVDACLQGDCEGSDLQGFLAGLQANTLLLLDASGSMAGDAGGGMTKMDAARDALVRYVRATPDFADLGLVVYGHRGDNTDAGRPESCAGVETFAGVGELTRDDAEQVVAGFQATGWTPIAGALDAAGPLLVEAAESRSASGTAGDGGVTSRVIVISDGIETCGGDPVASAQALTEMGIEVVVDVVGFDIGEADRAALEQVAAVTGGTYYDAADGRALRDVLAAYNRQVQDAVQPLRCQREALARNVTCANELAARATMWMRVTGRDMQDRGRGVFVSTWAGVLGEQARVLALEQRDALGDTIDMLLADLEEAQRLADEAFGDATDVSVGSDDWDCPWSSHAGFA
jgi:hypothetical protein